MRGLVRRNQVLLSLHNRSISYSIKWWSQERCGGAEEELTSTPLHSESQLLARLLPELPLWSSHRHSGNTFYSSTKHFSNTEPIQRKEKKIRVPGVVISRAGLAVRAPGHTLMLPMLKPLLLLARQFAWLIVFNDLFFKKMTLFDKYQAAVANLSNRSTAGLCWKLRQGFWVPYNCPAYFNVPYTKLQISLMAQRNQWLDSKLHFLSLLNATFLFSHMCVLIWEASD